MRQAHATCTISDRNIRDAGRGLVKRPGFTAVAVVSLALGIGANAALFSLFDVFTVTIPLQASASAGVAFIWCVRPWSDPEPQWSDPGLHNEEA